MSSARLHATMALTFGGDASNQLDLMSQVLSKFGPALAQNKEALSGFVERVNVFAKATGQDAATAGDQLMNVMLQLGVNVNDSAELLSESSHIMDVLAKAAQEGAAETSQLAESYLQVGSTAKQLGFSVEQVSAALEAMAFGGKTGAEAGVGLRNVLTSLVRPTGQSQEVLNQLGLTQARVAELMRTQGIAGVIEQLKAGLQSYSIRHRARSSACTRLRQGEPRSRGRTHQQPRQTKTATIRNTTRLSRCSTRASADTYAVAQRDTRSSAHCSG